MLAAAGAKTTKLSADRARLSGQLGDVGVQGAQEDGEPFDRDPGGAQVAADARPRPGSMHAVEQGVQPLARAHFARFTASRTRKMTSLSVLFCALAIHDVGRLIFGFTRIL